MPPAVTCGKDEPKLARSQKEFNDNPFTRNAAPHCAYRYSHSMVAGGLEEMS
jgi:hypothetical protein